MNPTSNHNFVGVYDFWIKVVYLMNPTSNHNLNDGLRSMLKLYIL